MEHLWAEIVTNLPAFNTLLSSLLILIVWKFGKQLLFEVRLTNGRLTKLEVWQHHHERHDDERHAETRQALRDLETRLSHFHKGEERC